MPKVIIPDELKEAQKAINKLNYQANKEKIKIHQKKYRASKKDDSVYIEKVRTYQREYYQEHSDYQDKCKSKAKEYYINVVKPRNEAKKQLTLNNQ